MTVLTSRLGTAATDLISRAGQSVVEPDRIRGVFVEGPSLASGRIANAVALPDGRVVVGVEPEEGIVPGTTTLRCSPAPCRPHLMLLDPRTGAFSPTPVPPGSPAVASMAVLLDGRVLVIGESADGVGLEPAMVYDPVADRFDEVGTPLQARVRPFLVTLADGRVLVGCGVSGAEPEGALATAELFDPKTGTFSPAGSMTRPRSFGLSATLLRDGRVLVVGGGPEVGTSAELYDPATETFSPTGSMTVARGGFQSATLLTDGRVLVAGGFVPHAGDPRAIPDPTATAEVYDPATATFSAVGPMAAPRFIHGASILADGTVLVVGGDHDYPAQGVPVPVGVSDAEIFDPATGTFRATGSLHRPRFLPAMVSIDDRVLVLGTLDPVGDDLGTGGSTEWFE
jgi:Kelch motif